MDIHNYLLKYSKNLNESDICHLDMENYDNLKKFIDNHYNLEHLKENNYLKYVKVTRQKIVLSGNTEYDTLIDKINILFEEMSTHYLFFKINFRKYLFNIKKIFVLLKKRQFGLKKELERFQELYNMFDSYNIKFKLLKTINACSRKISLFNVYKRKLLYHIHQFTILEYKHGIDQKMINIVNCERNLIGKKSEYKVNRILNEYVNEKNKGLKEPCYFYLENIDIFKIFNIKTTNNVKCKGEIDGLIIKKEDNDYIIEYLIEIKSSIKASFEDVHKIIGLKNFFMNVNFEDEKFLVKNIKLTKNSLKKIINYSVHNWLIYICNDDKNKIDKSHLYFSYILKIINYDFIKDYYINKQENEIKKKHKMIIDNKDYIDNLFNLWKLHINLTKNQSCIYIL